MKELRPFFSYYGAKWRLALRYPEPLHSTIVEPFAGAAGYSLRHGADRKVVLVERHPKVAKLWEFLIGASEADIRNIPLIGPDQSVEELGLPEGPALLVSIWLARATGGDPFPARPQAWFKKHHVGKYAGCFWGEKVRDRVASQVGAIKGWRIIGRDYAEAPDAEATWFVDPPYSSKSGRAYRHNDLDYEELGAWCQTRLGQVIVCEGQGAQWLPFQMLARSQSLLKDGGRPVFRNEVIWTQGCEVD